MPEAVVICCDCSEWMRNGDFMPNRFEAQKDALSAICNAKTQQNMENTVGLIAMGGDGKAEVLVNCTSDVGRILGSAHKMEIGGRCDILVALQTAQLALKHRKNKKQSQRIILFVGSPVDCKVKPLVTAAKKLKKNNVAVDVVDFGESDANADILASFLKAVNSSDGNSRMVTVPSGTHTLLSDQLLSSPICAPPSGGMSDLGFATGADVGMAGAAPVDAAALGGGPAAAGFLGGVDPSLDPELAEVLRLSMQEAEDADRDRATAVMSATGGGDAPATGSGDAAPTEAAASGAPVISAEVRQMAADMGMDPSELDADTLLALQMSMMQDYGEEPAADSGDAAAVTAVVDGDATMSSAATAVSAPSEEQPDEYMQELLEALPGLDASDINMEELLGKDTDKDKPDDDASAKGPSAS